MMLVDRDILRYTLERRINIVPWDDKNLGSNSYDLSLGDHLLVYTEKILDVKKVNPTKRVDIGQDGFTLLPGELYLAYTKEYTECDDLVPQLEGKSSIGRLGICVHLTAGFGDVGFKGHWTLELTCVKPVTIYAGMSIAQIFFFFPNSKAIKPYHQKKNSKYSEQGPTPVPSMMWKNFL